MLPQKNLHLFVLVNSVFLVLVLVSVYRHQRTRMSESELKEKGIHTKLAL